jgi:hypothetical protein
VSSGSQLKETAARFMLFAAMVVVLRELFKGWECDLRIRTSAMGSENFKCDMRRGESDISSEKFDMRCQDFALRSGKSDVAVRSLM